MLDYLLLSDPVSNRVPVLLVADDDEDILTLVQLLDKVVAGLTTVDELRRILI